MAQNDNNYPLQGFNFKVTATDSDTGRELETGESSYFKSISGISATSDKSGVQVIRDGKTYTLPSPPKFTPLVLEGGIVGSKSPLSVWCETYINGGGSNDASMYKSKTINILLMDRENESSVMEWAFYDCTPQSVKMNPFNAEDGKVVIETLTIQYSSYEIM